MKIVYFTHSLLSCWNHGNAHFLRGVLRELIHRGHDVVALEPRDSWSLGNLIAEHGLSGLDSFHAAYPELRPQQYASLAEIEPALDGAELVLVHEWNTPALVAELGRRRRLGAPFTLLFHDTHHRAVSEPEAMRAYDLDGYDGVLAFGATLAQTYRDWGWGDRAFIWHEAADTRLFRPPAQEGARSGAVWIGNWGDGERGAELEEFLLRPTRDAGLPLTIHGVRYPTEAQALLARHGATLRDWLPNARAPDVFARHLVTLHVPRRFYATTLPGIPTIRVFEALACGIPLVSAPWEDSEALFRPGVDYLVASSGAVATRQLRDLASDAEMRRELVANGLESIHARHSCAHRVDELMTISDLLRMPVAQA
ncbi:CgeB family protein [Plastoroseomonas arctica]|uniref:Glycosyltransferase n=1 Tax=Plastoroseomonas arctica TaxID=1509237 RepID=A0AAF1KN63_9PROT|nr:glycosyltransferase [Plastoroseomonas arctica]MBR0654178.1 glycosyltransferase [Plastoroseomonas arctica]